jgi:hypothetical protein
MNTGIGSASRLIEELETDHLLGVSIKDILQTSKNTDAVKLKARPDSER